MKNCLIDTNVVLRLFNKDAAEHRITSDAVYVSKEQDYSLCLAPQILYEFYVVATRPKKDNGLGWDSSETLKIICSLDEQFTFLEETKSTYENWLSIISGYQIYGKKAHDARLVAIMIANGIKYICTLNTSDFDGFDEIREIHPKSLIKQ